jgi:N,N'-diacetylchitobiose transport system substrate-binding protein
MPREMRMNVRVFAAAAVVAALAVVAVGASGASGGSAANTLTVWLQTDAQSGWSDVVAAANAQFKSQNAGWDVDVQYQTWGTHLAKFDATLARGNAPDVIEMGNTEMTKYMAAGAFQDLTGISFPNQGTWLAGLAASGKFGGKLYGVPYYAGLASSRTARCLQR